LEGLYILYITRDQLWAKPRPTFEPAIGRGSIRRLVRSCKRGISPHRWSSAAPDCLPSVTELFRSLLLVSAWTCHFRIFRSCLLVPAQNPPV